MWSCSKGATDDGWMTLACPDWRWWVGATEDSEELELVNSAKRGISWFGYETFWRNVDGSATLPSLAWLLMIQYIIIMIIKLNMHRGYLCGVFFIIYDDSLLAEIRQMVFWGCQHLWFVWLLYYNYDYSCSYCNPLQFNLSWAMIITCIIKLNHFTWQKFFAQSSYLCIAEMFQGINFHQCSKLTIGSMYLYTGQNSQDIILPMRAGDETGEKFL